MTTNRIPVDGVYAVPCDTPGRFNVWHESPAGQDDILLALSVLGSDIGITAPEPRTGTLDLNEEDTRQVAAGDMWRSLDGAFGAAVNAAIALCVADVEAWDAADRAAARPPTPLGLSEDDVRGISLWTHSHNLDDLVRHGTNVLVDACRDWVAEVDGTDAGSPS